MVWPPAPEALAWVSDSTAYSIFSQMFWWPLGSSLRAFNHSQTLSDHHGLMCGDKKFAFFYLEFYTTFSVKSHFRLCTVRKISDPLNICWPKTYGVGTHGEQKKSGCYCVLGNTAAFKAIFGPKGNLHCKKLRCWKWTLQANQNETNSPFRFLCPN